MGVTITFRDETKHERGENKYNETLLSRCKAEPLPQLI
jgi:hypothetical protein